MIGVDARHLLQKWEDRWVKEKVKMVLKGIWLGLPPFSVLVRVPAYCGIWLDIKPTTLSQNKGIALSFLIILFAWKLVKGSKKAFERNWFLVLWSFEISRQRIAKYFRNPPGLSCWMDQHYNNPHDQRLSTRPVPQHTCSKPLHQSLPWRRRSLQHTVFIITISATIGIIISNVIIILLITMMIQRGLNDSCIPH